MKMIKIITILVVVVCLVCIPYAVAGDVNGNGFLVLCYHDVPKNVYLDNYGVDRDSFVQQIEYLRTHGYKFVSLEDVVEANKGEKLLPPKAVLLTFDDAYLSFYEFVFPLLKLYGYPCVLSVVSNWIDDKPPVDIRAPIMSWEQLKEISNSNLVEITSHTHNLHGAILYNPQGNKNWAAVSHMYDPDAKMYETKEEFTQRIRNDFLLSKQTLQKKLNVKVRAITWPYGCYNQICIEEAKKIGFEVMFTVGDRLAQADNLSAIPRVMITKNPKIESFIKGLKNNFVEIVQKRIVQADLDILYNPDPLQFERNLDLFIERIFDMKATTIYLQAFCDKDGTGNISSVYFPNRILPMRADIFNRVVNQLSIRGIEVYAWMPMLSIVLPNEEDNEKLRVMEFSNGQKKLSTSWYERLSPFSPDVRKKLVMLYEDMAVNARIGGVVFQDDGYLNDFEDFSPEASKEYLKIIGDDSISYQELNEEQKWQWVRLKTKALIDLTEELKKAVVYYRPDACFVRTLYAPVLIEPESEEWLAQNFADSLKAYDYVAIMAYPRMEKIARPEKWLKKLVMEAKKYPKGLQKTVFKLQTYDWSKDSWINTKTVNRWLKILVSSGAQHVGYYPDDCFDNYPDEKLIRLMMSTEDFPFKRKWSENSTLLY